MTGAAEHPARAVEHRAAGGGLLTATLVLAATKVGFGAVLLVLLATGGADGIDGAMGSASVAGAAVQMALYLAVAAMVTIGPRVGRGFAAAYVGYAGAAMLARGDIGAWEGTALVTSFALLGLLLALWATGDPLPAPGRRPAAARALLTGAALGAAVALVLLALAG